MINTDKENLLIICPTTYKEKLLEKFSNDKKLIQLSFLTIEEYKKNILFDYDTKALKYLNEHYGLSVNNAKEILDNLIYVEDKNYGIEKLDTLVEYKGRLNDEGLLIYNPIFKEYIKDKNVVVCGYGELNSFDKKLIEGKTVVFETDFMKNKKYEIYEFEDIEDEVEYLYNSIFDLLSKGVDINNIYVLNAKAEYVSYLKRFNSYYDFKIDFKEENEIIGTILAKKFIEMIDTCSKEEIYDFLVSSKEEELSKQLINIINNYASYDLKEVKELIINDLSSTKINKKECFDVVRCVSNNTVFTENDHVFLIGFDNEFPTLKKDTDYITDSIRKEVGLSLVEEENMLIKENMKIYLSNINNLHISYSKKSPFSLHDFETLVDDYVIKTISFENNYSEKLNKNRYGNMLDRLNKFGYKDNEIESMYLNYDKNDYQSYNNSFKGPVSIDKRIKLSYSSMDTFYKCKFRYFLNSVLYLRDNKGTFYSRVGSLCHGVLKDLYYEPDFEFDKSWNSNLIKLEEENKYLVFENDKEKFFGEKIKEELKIDINIIEKQKSQSTLNKVKCEEKFSVDLTDRINFNGYIDKILYKELNDGYLTNIVDYKTGDTKIEESLIQFGLSLQLPSYMYLMRNSDFFKGNVKFGGFYLQNISNKDYRYEKKKDLETKKRESMMLNGFSSDDIDRLKQCDTSIDENGGTSENIRTIKTKKSDGMLYSSAKVKSDEEMDDLVKFVEEKILEAGNDILSGDFKINPILVNKKNVSCEYCEYRDICYRRNEDLTSKIIKGFNEEGGDE